MFKNMSFENAAVFFVEDIIPKLVEKIYQNYDVNSVKTQWENLAKVGYNAEAT